jgi:response regulator of citrate/malate metabolism
MQPPSQESIEKTIFENYFEYQYLFLEFQSKVLSDLYSRYKSIENGNIILYYAKQTHQEILRKKNYDLNFNLSLENLWENHREIHQPRISIIKIAKDTSIAKETARRKILELIKQKVLNKKKGNIGWHPSEEYKKNYDIFINLEIDGVSKLISFICKKQNYSFSSEAVIEELKKNFSFYWFHYLQVQLEYLKLWSTKLNDIELGLIFMQVSHLFASKIKKKNLSHKDLYDNPSLIKEYISVSISATSISEVTGIPRATCVRKLELLVKMKLVLQDKLTKRYYLFHHAISENLISQDITKHVVKFFSKFYFICIRAIVAKTSN